MPDITFDLGVFLAGLARGLAHEQLRLDAEHEKQLSAFAPVLRLARELGYEDEARALAPPLMSVARAEIGVCVHVSATREAATSVGVRLINLRYSRRYEHSQFVENSVRLAIESVPLAPSPGARSLPHKPSVKGDS